MRAHRRALEAWCEVGFEFTVSSKELGRIIGRMAPVQAELGAAAASRAAVARGVLKKHRRQGHSRITHTQGLVDHYVWLDDTRGLEAAAAIEYGRNIYRTEVLKTANGKVRKIRVPTGRKTRPVRALRTAFK